MKLERKIHTAIISKEDIATIKEKVLHYIASCDTFSFMDNNFYNQAPNRFELLAGVNVWKHISQDALSEQKDWIFGHLNFEQGPPPSFSDINTFSSKQFFIPITVISIAYGSCKLEIQSYDNPTAIFEAIANTIIPVHKPVSSNTTNDWTATVEKQQYIDTIDKIKGDIYYGKYYEINYCIKYFADNISKDPILVFQQQNKLNPAPFACCYKQGHNYLICTSPERFLYKDNLDIYCQPIKGTIANLHDPILNKQQRQLLYNNEKERAENVMIVDLTRNDLAQCCEVGTVHVPELFGIYEHPFVLQMISTIKGSLQPNQNFSSILDKTFPMGSMTGAPKKTVVEHIQAYEMHKRNIYSGSIFYIQPNGDFDANVVIRSLMYNTDTQRLEYYVGSAITIDSDPSQEWEELTWKASSMQRVLQ